MMEGLPAQILVYLHYRGIMNVRIAQI
jgi:hypothetical protein